MQLKKKRPLLHLVGFIGLLVLCLCTSRPAHAYVTVSPGDNYVSYGDGVIYPGTPSGDVTEADFDVISLPSGDYVYQGYAPIIPEDPDYRWAVALNSVVTADPEVETSTWYIHVPLDASAGDYKIRWRDAISGYYWLNLNVTVP